MLLIIVGDDQALRLQLARALGPGRFELLCAVPTADVVPPVGEDERLAALLAHKTPAAMRGDIERLRKRFGERVALVAIASREGHELEGLVAEIDDFVAWALGPTFLQARLQLVHKHLVAARTTRTARPMRSSVEDLLRTALGSGKDHLYVWDLASGRMDWPFAGEAAAQLPPTRQAFEERLHPDDQALVELALERHFTAQTPYVAAVRRGTPDEGYAFYLDRGELLGTRRDGRLIGLLTAIDDEVQVELNRRLEGRRTGIAEIAGALAEELNQSLLVAFTNLDGAIPKAAQPLRGDLQDARTALQGALDWTRRLMALGRRQPPQPEYIALQDLVQDLVDPLARRLGSHIALEVLSRDAGGIVLADPLHIETVLSILCDRAARQMPRGGRVRLTLGTTLLRDEVGPLPRPSEGRWAKLRIEDEGPHLPAAMVQGFFDPMAHGLHDGLRWAIALATVRSIVIQHEGFVRAVNLVGEHDEPAGVAFEVFLPVVVRAPARLRRPETGSQPAVGAGELVLVADDDELIRRMTERLLKGAGYQVLTVADGREAVRVFGERAADIKLVVLDVVMPEMGGRLASERMRALRPKVPFLFTSGYTMSIQDTEFVQDPSRRFLAKPYNAGQLLREVRAAIDEVRAD